MDGGSSRLHAGLHWKSVLPWCSLASTGLRILHSPKPAHGSRAGSGTSRKLPPRKTDPVRPLKLKPDLGLKSVSRFGWDEQQWNCTTAIGSPKNKAQKTSPKRSFSFGSNLIFPYVFHDKAHLPRRHVAETCVAVYKLGYCLPPPPPVKF